MSADFKSERQVWDSTPGAILINPPARGVLFRKQFSALLTDTITVAWRTSEELRLPCGYVLAISSRQPGVKHPVVKPVNFERFTKAVQQPGMPGLPLNQPPNRGE